jgi:hypothetical protein
LTYILTGEGRLIPNGSTFDREYFLTDHLGNTRVIFKKSGDMAAIVQEDLQMFQVFRNCWFRLSNPEPAITPYGSGFHNLCQRRKDKEPVDKNRKTGGYPVFFIKHKLV